MLTTLSLRRFLSRSTLMAASVLALASACPAPALSAEITTVLGTGQKSLGVAKGPANEFNCGQPFGVEAAPDGTIYVTEVENHRVLKLDPKTGEVVTIAGNGKKGYSGDGGPATEASMNEPYEVRLDAEGNLYVVEMVGAVIRKIDGKTGVISTIAGTGKPGYFGDDGPAIKAQFKQPHSIALDGQSGLYVADIGNNRIRKIDLNTGIVTSICGDGRPVAPNSGQLAKTEPVRGPRALAITGDTMWVALREGNSLWRINLKEGRIYHAAGTGMIRFDDGPADKATFNGPKGVAVSPDGGVYLVDTENQAIRRYDPATMVVSTVAGGGPQYRGFAGDGGDPLKARMDRPHGIAIDAAGAIYIGDTNNHRLRKIVVDGK